MSWLERAAERRLAEASAAGELTPPSRLAGKPIPGIDQPRSPGWWAEDFVRREKSGERHRLALAAAVKARIGFWRAATEEELDELVQAANQAIVAANVNLIDADRIEPFDPADTLRRWRELRSGS